MRDRHRLHSGRTLRPRSGLRSSALVCAVLCVAAVLLLPGGADEVVESVVVVLSCAAVGAVGYVALEARTPAVVERRVRLVGRTGVVLLVVAAAAALVAGSASSAFFLLLALVLGIVVLGVADRPLPVVSQKSRDRLADLERRRDERRGRRP